MLKPQALTPTAHPHINDLLDDLRAKLQRGLGDRLVGLYLYGSLVAGGFDCQVSDIDLLAAVTRDIDADQLEALREIHQSLVRDHPSWNDRVEVAYVSVAALRTFKAQTSRIAIISPGEPLHFKEAGRDWLMNWYLVREGNTTLLGPPPRGLIAPIAKAEFIDAVRMHARSSELWETRLPDLKSRSYTILTMCRALYVHQVGEHCSKEQAAVWAQRAFPEWAVLIRDALVWRLAPDTPFGSWETSDAWAMRFVRTVSELCAASSSDDESPPE